jgi:hypothetical protein
MYHPSRIGSNISGDFSKNDEKLIQSPGFDPVDPKKSYGIFPLLHAPK